MTTSTGRLPVNFAGGLYKKPEIIFPSKLFHRTSSASGKPSVFTAVSLVVHRSTFPVGTSSEYTSPGPRALFSENPSSCPFLCQCREPTTPVGSFGSGISCFVDVFITCRTLTPSSSVMNAIIFPSCVRSNEDRKSTRLNSSHQIISYAVFCLKKKKTPTSPLRSQG